MTRVWRLPLLICVGLLLLPLAMPASLAAPVKKVAVLLPGPADDHSWNEAAVKALQALKKSGYKTAMVESVAPTDAARLLRQFAAQGYGLIIAHSFSFQDAVFDVAKEYPKVDFAWPGGINGTAANVADYDQPFYQGAYLIGIIAGYVSKSHTLGALYGFDIPVCHAMGQAALAGARTVTLAAKLLSTAVGDWEDVAKAKEAGLAQHAAGADFWIACGEGPVYGTIGAAQDSGGYTMGYAGDMSQQGPKVVLVNLMWRLEPLFRRMIKDADNGHFGHKFYQQGVKDGVIDVAVNPGLAGKVPAAARAAVKKAKAEIVAGKLTVPYVPK